GSSTSVFIPNHPRISGAVRVRRIKHRIVCYHRSSERRLRLADRERSHMMLIKPFKIRDIEINPPLVLSPMAGVTDISFRRLVKQRGGVGLTVSEFISVEGLTRNNPKSKRQMRFYQNERPFAVQIFGGQPERMRMAAEMA